MRKVILFIAMSLDGYIADQYGKVDWLAGLDRQKDAIDTFEEFVKKIDTVIMGWKTYHQIITELSPEHWVYPNLKSYVVTHQQVTSTHNIIFTSEKPQDIVSKLKQKQGKDIWICGGSQMIQPLLKSQLIDEYYITVIPILLGSGIRLFQSEYYSVPLKLIHYRENNGMMELVYVHREE